MMTFLHLPDFFDNFVLRLLPPLVFFAWIFIVIHISEPIRSYVPNMTYWLITLAMITIVGLYVIWILLVNAMYEEEVSRRIIKSNN